MTWRILEVLSLEAMASDSGCLSRRIAFKLIRTTQKLFEALEVPDPFNLNDGLDLNALYIFALLITFK